MSVTADDAVREPDPHPWLATSLSARVVRVFVFALLVWLTWLAVNVLILGQNSDYGFLPGVPIGMAIVVVPAVWAAALAAVLQRLLTRFVPFTQALLFAVWLYATSFAALFVWGLVGSLTNGSCAASGTCAADMASGAAVTAIVMLPALLIGTVGYSIALASTTTRGRAVAGWTLAAALAAVAVAATALLTRVIGA